MNHDWHSGNTTLLTAAYLLTTALLVVLFGHATGRWLWLVAAHAATSVGLLAIARRDSLPRGVAMIRDWHPLLLFPVLYKEVELLAPIIGNWQLTSVIPKLEATLFHGQPAMYLSQRLPFVPLSEWLHFCYLAYVVVIPAVSAYWYFGGRHAAFHELMGRLATVMFASYLFFILFPVDSPYYLFDRLGSPLAGHFFFDLVHAVSDRGGARGGAFPSAHGSGAVVLWLVAWRHDRRLAILLSPLILGLLVATVYGRFHYALDTVAGAGVALIVALRQPRSG